MNQDTKEFVEKIISGFQETKYRFAGFLLDEHGQLIRIHINMTPAEELGYMEIIKQTMLMENMVSQTPKQSPILRPVR